MHWKQWLTLPGEGGLWALRHTGKWLQEAGNMELRQWVAEEPDSQPEPSFVYQQKSILAEQVERQ
jgi:hypothetical protein